MSGVRSPVYRWTDDQNFYPPNELAGDPTNPRLRRGWTTRYPANGAQLGFGSGSFDLEHGSGNSNCKILPMVVPWPYAADVYGVAYPAGTLGLVTRMYLTNLYNPASQWVGLVPVPDTLPAGYTARPEQGWIRRESRQNGVDGVDLAYSWGVLGDLSVTPDSGAYLLHDFVSVSGFPLILGSDGAFHNYPWHPMALDDRGYQWSEGANFLGSPLESVLSYGNGGVSPGFRSVHLYGELVGISGSDTVTIALQIDTGGGWTTVWTNAYAVGTGSPTVVDETITGWQAPTGTFAVFRVRVSRAGIQGAISFLNADCSLRCDVPAWFSTTGTADDGSPLIAPGGIATGSVPGY